MLHYELDVSTQKTAKTIDQLFDRWEARLRKIEGTMGKVLSGGPSGSRAANDGSQDRVRNAEKAAKQIEAIMARQELKAKQIARQSAARDADLISKSVQARERAERRIAAILKSQDSSSMAMRRVRVSEVQDTHAQMQQRIRQEQQARDRLAKQAQKQSSPVSRKQTDEMASIFKVMEKNNAKLKREDDKAVKAAKSRDERLSALRDTSRFQMDAKASNLAQFDVDQDLLNRSEDLRQAHEARINAIIQGAGGKRLSVVNAQIQAELAAYRAGMARLQTEQADRNNMALSRNARMNNKMMMGFQVQQMLEDFQHAGFRGASNNLAQFAYLLGGPVGIGALAALAAVSIGQLTMATIKWINGTKDASTVGEKFAATLKEIHELRGLQDETETMFKTPRSMSDQHEAVRKNAREQMLLKNNTQASGLDRDLKTLKMMKEEAKDFIGIWGQIFGTTTSGEKNAERLRKDREARANFEAMRQQLSRPEMGRDPAALDKAIEDTQKELDAVHAKNRAKKLELETQKRLLDENAGLVPVLERIAELEEKVKDGLSEQVSKSKQLVEQAKDRAKAVQDAEYARRDSAGSKMLDAESSFIERHYEKRAEAFTKADRKMQERMFQQRFGKDAEALRPQFERFLEGRAEAIEAAHERAAERRTRRLAQERAKMLKSRAESELESGKKLAQSGDLDGSNRMMDRARDSFQQLQELQLTWSQKASSPADQEAFIKEAKETEVWLQNVSKEAERAAGAVQKFQEGRLQTLLGEVTNQVKLLKVEAEDLEFIKEAELQKAAALEAKLKAILDHLTAIGNTKGGGAAGAAGGAGGGAGGLFSIPFDGPFPGGKANGGAAAQQAAMKPLMTRAEAGAKRIAEIQAHARAKAKIQEETREWRAANARQAREAAHQRRLATQARLDARKGGAKPAVPEKQPMKGDWNDPGPLHKNAMSRAQGYWPMIRQQLEKAEHDLRQVGSKAFGGKANSEMRTGKLQDLRKQAHALKNELDGGVSDRRAETIGDDLQQILKDIKGIDPVKPIKKAAERTGARWARRGSDGTWSGGEGMLAPESIRPKAGESITPDGFAKPGSVDIGTQDNSVTATTNIGVINTVNFDVGAAMKSTASGAKALQLMGPSAGPNVGASGRPLRANGGHVAGGLPYLVGERGMEVFVPEHSGRIISATDSARMMGRGVAPVTNSSSVSNRNYNQSVGVININAYGKVDSRSITREMSWSNKAATARAGGNY